MADGKRPVTKIVPAKRELAKGQRRKAAETVCCGRHERSVRGMPPYAAKEKALPGQGLREGQPRGPVQRGQGLLDLF